MVKGFKAKTRVKIAGKPAEQKNSTKFTPKARTINPKMVAKLIKGALAIFSILSFIFNCRSTKEFKPKTLQTPGL